MLYIGCNDYVALKEALVQAAHTLSVSLNEKVPRMTSCLAPGLGMAEGNLDGASFGDSRCRLIADVYENADAAVRKSPLELTHALINAFLGLGLDAGHPYLEPRTS